MLVHVGNELVPPAPYKIIDDYSGYACRACAFEGNSSPATYRVEFKGDGKVFKWYSCRAHLNARLEQIIAWIENYQSQPSVKKRVMAADLDRPLKYAPSRRLMPWED